MKLRDRIKSLRRVRARDLRPNPKNWRTHPQAQQDALRGVLAEVGIADALLARELPDKSLVLIDGHLRADVDPETKWPVLILDVTEEEAALLLATLDPLAGMAETNPENLAELLAGVQTVSAAVQAVLDGLAEEAGIGMELPDVDQLEQQFLDQADAKTASLRLRIVCRVEDRDDLLDALRKSVSEYVGAKLYEV